MFYSHVEEPSNVVIFSNGLVVFSPLMQFKVPIKSIYSYFLGASYMQEAKDLIYIP